MRFKPLPPGKAEELIQGHVDILTPLVQQRDHRVALAPCPRCKAVLQKRLHPSHLFTDGDLLPRTVAYCVDCGYTQDTATGLILELGSMANLEERKG